MISNNMISNNEITNIDDDWFNDVDESNLDIISSKIIEEKHDIISEKITTIDTQIQVTEYIYIEDILEKKLENTSVINIIQYECFLICGIQAIIDGDKFNKIKTIKKYSDDIDLEKISDILNYFKWINNASDYLAKKINQELFVNDFVQTEPKIIRSSYNFCPKYTQCNFYNKNRNHICNDHHFVHSILKYDTDSIINYLEYILKDNIKMMIVFQKV